MSSDRGPGPAYSLGQPSDNGILDAQHYITTFVLALIIQDYIRNMSEHIVTGVVPPVIPLLAGGLVVLLVFAFEAYGTAVGRNDPLRRGEVTFEVARAVFGLFGLFGLHNFSLVLTRYSTANVTAAVIATQFGYGLAVVFGSYFAIRLVVTAQNYTHGKPIEEQRTAAVLLYLTYVGFWGGYALIVSRLSSWGITVSFVVAAAASLTIYIWYWQDRFKTMAGLDPEPDDAWDGLPSSSRR